MVLDTTPVASSGGKLEAGEFRCPNFLTATVVGDDMENTATTQKIPMSEALEVAMDNTEVMRNSKRVGR